MPTTHLSRLALGALVPLAAALLVAACSPTFGGGEAPAREVIIVPQGQPAPSGAVVVCADGRRPPC